MKIKSLSAESVAILRAKNVQGWSTDSDLSPKQVANIQHYLATGDRRFLYETGYPKPVIPVEIDDDFLAALEQFG